MLDEDHKHQVGSRTNKCTSHAHNSICSVQHAGVLVAVLHAAVDAGKDGMPREHKGAEAKGDGQAVQVHRDGLRHMNAPGNKVIHHHPCTAKFQCQA